MTIDSNNGDYFKSTLILNKILHTKATNCITLWHIYCILYGFQNV
jgi:hypothetical protein